MQLAPGIQGRLRPLCRAHGCRSSHRQRLSVRPIAAGWWPPTCCTLAAATTDELRAVLQPKAAMRHTNSTKWRIWQMQE